MRYRFLYLGSSGSQTEVASLDDLRALIEKGTVGETTPLFDVLAQQWAPACAHAVYRLLCEDARLAAAPLPPLARSTADGLPDLGLTVELAKPSVPDTDQAVRALLKERERDGESAGRHPADPFGDPRSWSARPRESTAVAPVATPPAAVARAAAAHA